ncbi:hypothetical protein ACFFSH_24005 [Streptomyces filamentosus]|uniref:Uncharacterized protein n=1 Tax=Streptomyces filamentosus TaxID=67294 RepID=A0A919BPJ7_STRFL|nr:hypothetical protein [Streptomyces filamentosus]GHG05840.1 hypothetical protein GCM10017667_41010 [Streptomyces filamentosus]
MECAQDDEEGEDLARMLIAAAWCQVHTRSPLGFAYTPLSLSAHEDPAGFTLERLLALPHPDMVEDVVAQVYRAADSALAGLRARTSPRACTAGPTFPDFGRRLTADADLAADDVLLDFKSTRYPQTLRQADAWQLLGYLLLDASDGYHVDAVGVCFTRSGVLATWSVEEYLDLLGICRRNLAELRAVFARLLNGCTAGLEPWEPDDINRVQRLLAELEPQAAPDHCLVCTRPLPAGSRKSFCTAWCATRAATLRNHGHLSPTHSPVPPEHHCRPAEPGPEWEVVSITRSHTSGAPPDRNSPPPGATAPASPSGEARGRNGAGPPLWRPIRNCAPGAEFVRSRWGGVQDRRPTGRGRAVRAICAVSRPQRVHVRRSPARGGRVAIAGGRR